MDSDAVALDDFEVMGFLGMTGVLYVSIFSKFAVE